MPQLQIERVDSLPVILHWLLRMQIDIIIDRIWYPHPNWQGLSYGQLAVLFIAYVIHQRRHCLSGMEDWVMSHRRALEHITGWTIGAKEASDDRLGRLMSSLGQAEDQSVQLQRQMGSHLIQAFALATDVARYDTTSFNVHHAPAKAGQSEHEVLRYGYSKDHRPDLLQFKQGIGTLDPAGVPLVTHTLAGQVADDGLYISAWQEMVITIGHSAFLFVADCKAAASQIRASLDQRDGRYLFPLPMTGEVPDWLGQQVLSGSVKAMPIRLADVVDSHGQPKLIGHGFVVARTLSEMLPDGTAHTWTEQWFVVQSCAQAKRQQANLQARLDQARAELKRLRPKAEETALEFHYRAKQILIQRRVTDYLDLTVTETKTTHKRYLKPGRPRPDSPYRWITQRHLHLQIHLEQTAFAQALHLAGWRVYVSNTSPDQMSLSQAIAYYRDEWLVERAFHRFKHGSLPTLPLWIRLPERIKGLMLLLLVALQALTLLEFVAQRSLAQQQHTIAGLVPGNPKHKTDRPSAERLLAVFTKLHLVIESTPTQVTAHLNETLTPLQRRILALLSLPESIYDFQFILPRPQFYNST